MCDERGGSRVAPICRVIGLERISLAGETFDGFEGLVGVAFHVAGVVDDVADDAL